MATTSPSSSSCTARATRPRRTRSSAPLLAKIQCDIQRLKRPEARRGRRQGRQRTRSTLFEKGGKAYFELWEKYGARPLKQQPAAAVRAMDEIVVQRRACLPGGPPRRQGDRGPHDASQPAVPHGEDGAREEGHATRSAATTRPSRSTTRRRNWYERYAPPMPTARPARAALPARPTRPCPTPSSSASARLRKTRPSSDAKQYFSKNYGAAKPDRRRRPSRSPSARTTPTRKTGKTPARPSPAPWAPSTKAPPDIQVQAHATLRAVARAPQERRPGARASTTRSASSGRPTAAPSRARSVTPTSPRATDSQARRLGKALNAVGEAMFYAAEEKRSTTRSIRSTSPPTRARAARTTSRSTSKTKVKPWYLKKNDAITDGRAKEYQKIARAPAGAAADAGSSPRAPAPG